MIEAVTKPKNPGRVAAGEQLVKKVDFVIKHTELRFHLLPFKLCFLGCRSSVERCD